MDSKLLKDVLNLPGEDKLILIENILESISNKPEEFPIPQAQKDELDIRLNSYKENPDDVIPWETFKAELLNRK